MPDQTDPYIEGIDLIYITFILFNNYCALINKSRSHEVCRYIDYEEVYCSILFIFDFIDSVTAERDSSKLTTCFNNE